jgi:uncharacterized membrane protein
MAAKSNMFNWFRHVAAVTVCAYLISGYLTGVGYGHSGHYESFIFLMTAAAVLVVIYFLTFFINISTVSKVEKCGLLFLIISMITVALVSLMCNYQAIYQGSEWDHASTTMFFMTAIPATLMFGIGCIILIYGVVRRMFLNR